MRALLVIWIVVVLVLLVLGTIVAYLTIRRRNVQNHTRAKDLRTEAASGAGAIPDAQARAQEAEARLERARLEVQRAEADAAEANRQLSVEQAGYEDQIRAADRLDPEVDHRSADYAPDTSTTEIGQPAYERRRPNGGGGAHRA